MRDQRQLFIRAIVIGAFVLVGYVACDIAMRALARECSPPRVRRALEVRIINESRSSKWRLVFECLWDSPQASRSVQKEWQKLTIRFSDRRLVQIDECIVSGNPIRLAQHLAESLIDCGIDVSSNAVCKEIESIAELILQIHESGFELAPSRQFSGTGASRELIESAPWREMTNRQVDVSASGSHEKVRYYSETELLQDDPFFIYGSISVCQGLAVILFFVLCSLSARGRLGAGLSQRRAAEHT